MFVDIKQSIKMHIKYNKLSRIIKLAQKLNKTNKLKVQSIHKNNKINKMLLMNKKVNNSYQYKRSK